MAKPTTRDTGQIRLTAVYKHIHLAPEESTAGRAGVRLYSGAAGPGAVGGRLCNIKRVECPLAPARGCEWLFEKLGLAGN